MNIRPLLIVNSLLISAMAALTVWVWPSVPDGAQVPVHWGLDGHVDRLGSKNEALLTIPLLAAAITLIFVVLPRFDPRRKNLERSGKLWNAAAIGIVLLMAGAHLFLILTATGQDHDIRNFLLPGIAGLFLILGNYLGKTRSNWFAGVRTPWSLSSDYSWDKTHRWAGRLFVLTGVLTFAAWLVADPASAVFVMIGATAATSAISVVLSYFYWKNDPDRVNGDA